jgi:PERQ amino acid-rich with GYF domain-containing protein
MPRAAPEPVAPPDSGWEYIDTTGNVQGPFSIKEMRQWNQYGYFRPELMMRASKMDAFQPLKEMYPDAMQAFAVAPRKPRVGRPDL